MKKEKSKVSKIIVKDIIYKIQTEEYSVGSRLPSEMVLASRFNVGRSTVREALSVLKSLGIISSRQGGGHFIEEVDLTFLVTNMELETSEYKQIKSLFEIRYTLELQAAYLAAERRTEEDLVKLRKALDDFKETLLSSDDTGRDEDFRFHKALFEATHNPFMIKIMDNLSEWFQKALAVTLRQNIGLVEKRHSVYKEHEDLFKAIEEGKPELAKVLCKMHLDNVQKKLNYLFLFQD
ncbi:FadR/GntR family transcriptional regulator [Peribacillus glennii]|uniref:FadR family transcriptional regulator n=1 Tax=Peribacillus glennii TaxID=2303991 RepID=A0A372LES8_9BACI|nr:FadR/GntR family transcriptional regulator [Peribacillus glennii]RFU64811.1 FadR family transcriptional regulator [Peribacillus glennii]